jgi:alpha-glucosidase
MQPVISNTTQKADCLFVHLYCGDHDNDFLFYQDDGISFDYQKGVFSQRLLRYHATENRFVIHKASGPYASHYKKLKVMFHGFPMMNTIRINGESKDIHPEINRFFKGLEKYDPIKDPEPAPEETVMGIEMAYSADEMVLEW